MFKISTQCLPYLAAMLVAVYTAAAAPQPGLNKAKLTAPEKILEPFEQGQSFVRVTVNIIPPNKAANTNWHSQKSLSSRREAILQRQLQVLATLPPNEVLLRHRFENLTSFSAEVTLAGLQKLSNHPMVESIEPVLILEPHVLQGINLMNAATTRTTYNGQGLAIAICDTGIDYTHPALGNGGFPNSKVIGGYDFGDDDSDPMPNGQAHGTCCAGIAAGDNTNVGDYIGGVAYGAKLYALKITPGTSGSASSDDMAAAWDWCVTHQYDNPANPIMVISTSFGGGQYYSACDGSVPSMTTAANNAVAAGMTLLVSSGNDGYCDSIAWPACISSVISVGAVYDAAFGTYYPCLSAESCAAKTYSPSSGCPDDYYATDVTAADKVTSYSNTASFLDILAPSNQAYTTDIVGSDGYSTGDYYTSFGGTSAACPYAAGAVAILQSASMATTGSFLTPEDVRTLLTSTGDDITDEKVAITKPRVNVGTAMTFFAASPPTAANSSETTHIDTAVDIALNATDEGLPNPPGALSYIITTLPDHGTLSDPAAGSITSVPYTLLSNGNQVTYTPNAAYLGSDSFQFKANDGGTAPDGGDSNTATVSISVIPQPQVIYSASMDTDPGWTYEGNKFNWRWGIPAGSGGADHGNPDPTSGYTGSNVVGYNLSGDYSNSITTTKWTTTGTIDCTGQTGVTLSFYRWLNVEQPLYDHAYIQCSNDGAAWTTIWENADEITDTSWILQTFDISAIADNQPTVYIRWGMGPTDSSWNYSGWNIDDVQVAGNAPSAQYTLTTSSTSGGSVTAPGEGPFQYTSGSVVNLNAAPELHYHFVDWTGTAVTAGNVAGPTSAATTVLVDNDYTVQANFTADTFALHYAAGAGGTLTGNTSQVVAYGGNGMAVTAVPDAGYTFVNWSDASTENPRTDVNITANINVTANFEHTPVIVSGFVTEPDPNTPVANVIITSGGIPVAATDSNGYFAFIIDYGWSGTLTPSKTGYTFEPSSITYNTLTADPNDTYIAILDTYVISGYAVDAAGFAPLAGVWVSPENDGGPFTSKYYGGADVTDANGFYEVRVDTGFSGDVIPSKTGYKFDPNGMTYLNVMSDIAEPNDYTGTMLTYTISGYVKNPCEVPIQGVVMNATSGASDVTDPNGYYEVWVDYNWSGMVTPTKANYTFDPNEMTYTAVLGSPVNQDYLAANIYDLNCDGSIEAGDLSILCNNWLTVGPDIPGDFYKDPNNIVNLPDFAAFSNVWGQ